MKKRLQQLICKYGVQLCAVAMAISPLISEGCKSKYYQPKEPDGFAEFAHNCKKHQTCYYKTVILKKEENRMDDNPPIK